MESTRVVCLVAFTHEITSFMCDADVNRLVNVSRLLRTVNASRTGKIERAKRAQQVQSFLQSQSSLMHEFKILLQGSRQNSHHHAKIKKSSVRLSDAQRQPLLRDLVLVGLGVRASCLVDTCQLNDATVQHILEAFTAAQKWRAYGLHTVQAVYLAGNLFFVNRREFVRLKCRDLVGKLHNVALVDASATHKSPRVVGVSSPQDTALQRKLLVSLLGLVGKLVASTSAGSHQQLIRLSSTNATAMAGLLLCYPVVYHITGSSESDGNLQVNDPFWETSDNCLSMCPLHLIQASITMKSSETQHSLPLHEFSIPQHCVSTCIVKRIVRKCTESLIAAIGEQQDRIQVHVHVTPRTLAQVAL